MRIQRLLVLLALLALPGCGDSLPAAEDTGSSAGVSDQTTGSAAQATGESDSRSRSPVEVSTTPTSHARRDGGTSSRSGGPGEGTAPPASPVPTGSPDSSDTSREPSAEETTTTRPPVCSPADPPTLWLPVDADDGAVWEGSLDSCTRIGLAWVAAHSMQWELRIEGLPATDRAQAFTAHRHHRHDVPVLATSTLEEDAQTLTLTTITSGEQLLTFEREDLLNTHELRITWHCLEGCDRLATRFPVVLVHGYAGVDSYFGLLDYFHDVTGPNRSRGYALYTPTTSPVATSQRRAEQLAEQVDAILEETGARRLNFLAHSQGGLDVRVLISGMKYADRVASLTTIATPHHGIPLRLAEFLSVQDFSPDYMEVFNLAYPDADGVRYWSWSFRTCRAEQLVCRSRSDWERVNTLLVASHLLLSRFGESDGIVPTESMLWGEHLGMHFADHFGQIGQIARPSFVGPFRHRDFYRDELARLTGEGL